MIVFVPEKNEIHTKAIEELKKAGHEIIFGHELNHDDENKIQILFIRTYITANKEYFNQFPNLRYILKVGVGLDNIDLGECKKRNIQVINAPQSNSNSVAELVVCLMLMLLRHARQQSHRLRHGDRRAKELMGEELKGKTIGFVGCGAIARSITEKILAFQVKEILGYDPYLDEKTLAGFKIKKVDLNFLIKNSNIISLHLPLTAETKDLITLTEFRKMKKNCYLINTSRGGIVNENDLITALKQKIIKGAALDVFENEPEIKKEFLSLENIILTPHIGAYTHEADYEMSMIPVRKFLVQDISNI